MHYDSKRISLSNFSNLSSPILATREEDWMWFRGDTVEVLKGPDKGKFGIINMIVQVGSSLESSSSSDPSRSATG